ncbi:MAG TPA: tryptophan synthase subunit alpha [Thermoanaerobaculia bacterium]|nr:tryptophan synthase subunit alpha [Thermoanaerobaculia bacterium]
MSAIDQVFARCAAERRAAFIPFLMAGDPDLAATADLLDALAAGGADLIELGVPFSDPIADGPVNQRAATRALAAGTKLSGILELVARHRDRLGIPIVLFTYYNPIHARGAARFAEQAAASGVDGVLCVDLPPEEGERELVPALRERGLDTIFLLAPTSTRARVGLVAAVSSGFVYYVSRTGVTGERSALPPELVRELKRLRRRLALPLAVGFGISSPDQVAALGDVADGVVVGSALVHLVEEWGADPRLPALLENRVRELASALHHGHPSGARRAAAD